MMIYLHMEIIVHVFMFPMIEMPVDVEQAVPTCTTPEDIAEA